MNTRNLLFALSLTVVGLSAQRSDAAVLGYSAGYLGSYEQTSDAAPAGTPYFVYSALIGTDTDGDATAGTLTQPDANVINMFYSPPRYLVHYSGYYNSVAGIMADYPAGNLQFQVSAGNIAPASGSLFVNDEDFPNEIPYLNNGSWSALQLAPANTDAPVTWPAFTHSGLMPDLSSQFILYDMTANGSTFSDYGPNPLTTGTTIPGAEMKSGHQYFYSLYYYCQKSNSNQGFGGAASNSSYAIRSEGFFKVKALPGTISGKITLGDSVRGAGEQIEVQIMSTTGVQETQTITLGLDGYYAFNTTLTGNRTIKFRGRTWLRKAVDNGNLDTGEDYFNVTLQNGDVDGSGEVDAADIDAVIALFGTVSGDPNYDLDADVDGSSEVDAADIDIVIANFGGVDD